MTPLSFFLQDKSSSIAPHSVKYLVGEDADIIHVNVGSGMTTAHIASLLEADSRSHIWAFGARNQAEVRENMEKLGVKGIVLDQLVLPIEHFDLNKFILVCVSTGTGICIEVFNTLSKIPLKINQ